MTLSKYLSVGGGKVLSVGTSKWLAGGGSTFFDLRNYSVTDETIGAFTSLAKPDGAQDGDKLVLTVGRKSGATPVPAPPGFTFVDTDDAGMTLVFTRTVSGDGSSYALGTGPFAAASCFCFRWYDNLTVERVTGTTPLDVPGHPGRYNIIASSWDDYYFLTSGGSSGWTTLARHVTFNGPRPAVSHSPTGSSPATYTPGVGSASIRSVAIYVGW